MAEHVKKLLTLYENGIIDGDALNDALKAPQASQAQGKNSHRQGERKTT